MQGERQHLLSVNSEIGQDPYSQATLVSMYPHSQRTATAIAERQAIVAKNNQKSFFCHLNTFRFLGMMSATYSALVSGLHDYSILDQENSVLVDFVNPAIQLSFLLLAFASIKPIAKDAQRSKCIIFLSNALLATSFGLSVSKSFQSKLYNSNAENITFLLGLALLSYGLINDFNDIVRHSLLVKRAQYLTAMAALTAVGLLITRIMTDSYSFWANFMQSTAITSHLLTMTLAGLQTTQMETNKLNVLQSIFYFLATGGAIMNLINNFIFLPINSRQLLNTAIALGALAEFCLGHSLLSTNMAKQQPNQANNTDVLRSLSRGRHQALTLEP